MYKTTFNISVPVQAITVIREVYLITVWPAHYTSQSYWRTQNKDLQPLALSSKNGLPICLIFNNNGNEKISFAGSFCAAG